MTLVPVFPVSLVSGPGPLSHIIAAFPQQLSVQEVHLLTGLGCYSFVKINTKSAKDFVLSNYLILLAIGYNLTRNQTLRAWF